MIINDLDGYYIVFDTKNWNTELDTLQNKSQPSLEQLLQVAKLLSISPKDLINDINNSEAENV